MTYHTPGLLDEMDRYAAAKFAEMLRLWRAEVPLICQPALPPRGPKPEEHGKFTDLEDEVMRTHWPHRKAKVIAAILRRPVNSIYSRAQKLGLTGQV